MCIKIFTILFGSKEFMSLRKLTELEETSISMNPSSSHRYCMESNDAIAETFKVHLRSNRHKENWEAVSFKRGKYILNSRKFHHPWWCPEFFNSP